MEADELDRGVSLSLRARGTAQLPSCSLLAVPRPSPESERLAEVEGQSSPPRRHALTRQAGHVLQ
jgi:hypothetical protein